MATVKSFTLKKDIFERRKLTTLQHKLRVVLKCYTIREFVLSENNSFTFKVSRKINGLKLDSAKEYVGSFETEDINENELRLRIVI